MSRDSGTELSGVAVTRGQRHASIISNMKHLRGKTLAMRGSNIARLEKLRRCTLLAFQLAVFGLHHGYSEIIVERVATYTAFPSQASIVSIMQRIIKAEFDSPRASHSGKAPIRFSAECARIEAPHRHSGSEVLGEGLAPSSWCLGSVVSSPSGGSGSQRSLFNLIVDKLLWRQVKYRILKICRQSISSAFKFAKKPRFSNEYDFAALTDLFPLLEIRKYDLLDNIARQFQ